MAEATKKDAPERPAIVKRDIELPGSTAMVQNKKKKLAFVLENVFTPEECKRYIKITEKKGYEEALLNIGGRQMMVKDVRNSSRCVWDSEEEAEKIWSRIREYIPETMWNKKVVGLNERLRFLRYDRGEYFGPHLDGSSCRENGERSYITIQLYLNEECKQFIKITERKGYEEALVNVGGGRQMLMKDVRNSSRCIWDSEEEADKIWSRIKEYVPETWSNKKVIGLNERLRFLRYDPGEFFAPHMDGCYCRENGERSYITVQLYLNEGFKGGSTTFLSNIYGDDDDGSVECVPKTGMVLIFEHNLLHEGSILKVGRKYAMRTDVMYSRS